MIDEAAEGIRALKERLVVLRRHRRKLHQKLCMRLLEPNWVETAAKAAKKYHAQNR